MIITKKENEEYTWENFKEREREASDTHGHAKAMMEKTITVLSKQETGVLYNLN